MNAKLKRIGPATPRNAPIQSTEPPTPAPMVLGKEGNAIRRVNAFFIAPEGTFELTPTEVMLNLL